MTILVWLVPIALVMGGIALCAFLWSLKAGQYDDLEGAAERILLPRDRPAPEPGEPSTQEQVGESRIR